MNTASADRRAPRKPTMHKLRVVSSRVYFLILPILLLVLPGAPSVAWGGQGWYLFSPPSIQILHSATIVPGNERPLMEWRHDGAFDTAQECEVVRRSLQSWALEGSKVSQCHPAAPPGSAAAHLSPLLDREPVAAQDGPGHRAIAVLTLAFAVTRLVPREDPRARRAMTENGFYVIGSTGFRVGRDRGPRSGSRWPS